MEEEQRFMIVSVEPEVDEVEVSRKQGDAMHIVGMHTHAEVHWHSHPRGQGTCTGGDRHQHSHGHAHEKDSEVSSHVRHVVVSQILELVIGSNSVIIGLLLGVSCSPCTIRSLVAALYFHQLFKGFALRGCISQANFEGDGRIMEIDVKELREFVGFKR